MLKLFYKTLLVSVLSGALLMLDFSYKGAIVQFNSAQAETLKTDAVNDSNMMATLTMTAVGMLASRLYSYKMTTDIMLAAAGGAAFLAGEVSSFLAEKSAIKDLETQIQRDKTGAPTQQQITVLEKLKQSYVDAKKTAGTKKTFQMAAAAAFAAAGVAAYTMAATEDAMQAQCLLGLQTATSAAYATDKAVCTGLHTSYAECTPTCTGPQAAACLAACTASFQVPATTCDTVTTACKSKITADQAQMKAYIMTRETPSPSATGLSTSTSQASGVSSSISASASTCTAPYGTAELGAENGGNCIAKTAVDIQDASGGSPSTLFASFDRYPAIQKILFPHGDAMLVASTEKKSWLQKTVNFFMSEAHADLLSPMGIASSAAVSFVLATNTALATTLDLNLLIPKRRAIAWGILAGLAFAASSATGSEIEKIQSNIDKIDAILNSMYKLNNGVVVAQTPAVQKMTVEKTITPEVKAGVMNYKEPESVDLGKGGGKLPCMTGDKSCPSFSTQFNALTAPGSTVGLTQVQLGALKTMADGVNGTSTISSGTIKSAESLASQAVALRDEVAKQQKKMQDALKASGSNLDIAKASSDLSDELQGIVAKELKNRNTTAGAMLASFSGGSGSSGSASSAVASDANKNAKAVAAKKPVIAPVGVVDMSSSLNAGKGLNNGLTLDANKKDDAALTADAAKAGAGATMDDYVLKNDITQDKDSSLFDLISNRYQKSGYPRLFKKIK